MKCPHCGLALAYEPSPPDAERRERERRMLRELAVTVERYAEHNRRHAARIAEGQPA